MLLQVKKDLPIVLDPQMIAGVLDAIGNLNNIDDRKMLVSFTMYKHSSARTDVG